MPKPLIWVIFMGMCSSKPPELDYSCLFTLLDKYERSHLWIKISSELVYRHWSKTLYLAVIFSVNEHSNRSNFCSLTKVFWIRCYVFLEDLLHYSLPLLWGPMFENNVNGRRFLNLPQMVKMTYVHFSENTNRFLSKKVIAWYRLRSWVVYPIP